MKTLNQKIEKQPIEYYLNLQYPVTLYPDPDRGYVAQIKDLPGCLTQGETFSSGSYRGLLVMDYLYFIVRQC